MGDADSQAIRSIRLSGALLAVGSLLLLVGLGLHPTPAPDVTGQMALISENLTWWMAVHSVIAAGVSIFAVTGLIVLTARSRLTQAWWTETAWAVLVVAALWMMLNAVAEATALAQTAVAGNMSEFEAWEAFAIGMAMAIPVFTLAIAVIAGNEARIANGALPTWAAWIGTAIAIAASGGGFLWFTLEIGLAGFVWAIATLAISVWLLWFGVALVRSPQSRVPDENANL